MSDDQAASAASGEILFGGSTTSPFAAGVTGGQAPWVRALEAAFTQLTSTPKGRDAYGDPNRGATLVQAWRTVQLFGVPPRVCLLVTGQPRVAVDGITRVISLSADDFVAGLATLLTRDTRAAAQLFTFDGRTGHAVMLLGADADGTGFTFHDPWPGDSLLSRHANAAGVDARRVGTRWHVTAAELARVAVAAFVPPLLWAEVTGQPGRLSYAAFQATEFWSFFHVREASRDDRDPTSVLVLLKTGGFAEHVDLELTLGERALVTSAELRLRESWLIGPPYGVNPFATDVAASFLATATPPLDRPQVEPITRVIRAFRLDAATKARLEDPEFIASDTGRALQAYAGVGSDSLRLPMAGSVLGIETDSSVGEPWRSLRIDCV